MKESRTGWHCKSYYRLLLAILVVSALAIFPQVEISYAQITVTATVPGVCGNGILEPGEQCEGIDLNNKTCADFNFSAGTLSCSGACSFDISQCTGLIPPHGGGGGGGSGGGGGGGSGSNTTLTGVTFNGKAYPLSKVTLLKDGNVAVSSISGPDANFSISLSSLSPGNHIFVLYTEDSKGRRSNLFSVPVFVSSGASTLVQGIFLAPTISLDKIEVKRNETLSIFGQSAPQSNVTIMVHSENEIIKIAPSDANGVYLYNLDTSLLEYGTHGVSSKATIANNISGVSPVLSFKVSDKNVMAASEQLTNLIGDFNHDGRVNLIDFSIGAYWYKRAGFPPEIDLNHDGQFNIIDLSIIAYHWTG